MTKEVFYLFLTFLFIIMILYFSIIPAAPSKYPHSDKFKHFLAYFFLSFAMYKSIKSFKLTILLAVIYGFLMESLQFTLPFRAFDLVDIMFNCLGVFSAGFIKVFER